MNVSHDERDRFLHPGISLGRGLRAKAIDAELAPARGKIRGGHGLNCFASHKLIIAAVRLPKAIRGSATRVP